MEFKTPLYEEHVKAGGKIVPFAGYLLPVQYPAGVIKEHMAVRTKAGLFDVSIWRDTLHRTGCQSKFADASDKRLYKDQGRAGKVQPDVQ